MIVDTSMTRSGSETATHYSLLSYLPGPDPDPSLLASSCGSCFSKVGFRVDCSIHPGVLACGSLSSVRVFQSLYGCFPFHSNFRETQHWQEERACRCREGI